MIAKLIKYDLIKTSRTLKYLYAITLGIAVLTRIINLFNYIFAFYIVGLILAGCTYSMIANALINTIIHVLRNFMSDFYGDRSYLIHTLPVSKNQLFTAKYLTSLILLVASLVISIGSLALVLLTPELASSLNTLLASEIPGFDIQAWVFVIIFAIIIIVQICAYMSFGFFAVIKANTYNRKRVGMGFLWFGITYAVSMFGIMLFTIIVTAIFGDVAQIFADKLDSHTLKLVFISISIAYVIEMIICVYLSNKTFNKGVNVD